MGALNEAKKEMDTVEKFIFPIPSTNHDLIKETKMKESCLLLSVIFGLSHIKKMWYGKSDFDKLCLINSESKEDREYAFALISSKYDKLTEGNDPPVGPLTSHDASPYLDKMKVQVHIYSLRAGRTHYKESMPKELDNTREQIYLLASEINGLSHVDLLTHPRTFFRKYGIHCLHCNIVCKSQGGSYRHVCLKGSEIQCQGCRREYRKFNQIYHPDLDGLFCKSKMLSEEDGLTCEECNYIFKNSDCKANHTKAICSRRWICKDCKRSIPCQSESDRIKVKARHVCVKKECTRCEENYDFEKPHYCGLIKATQQPRHPNVGFLNFMYRQTDNGKDYQLRPKAAVLLSEENSKGNFETRYFQDTGLSEPEELETSFFEYWPSNEDSFNQQGKLGKFGHEIKTREEGISIRESCKNETVMKVLDYILNKRRSNFRNMSILTFDSLDMRYVLSALTRLDIPWEKNVTNKGTQVMTITIPEFNLTFLTLKNYLARSKQDIIDQYGEENDPLFFPQKWNDNKHESYCGKAPTLEDLQMFQDNDAILSRKKKFVNGLSDQWDYREELRRFLHFETKCLLKAGLSYLKECILFEKKCQDHFKLKSEEGVKSYCHPFTSKTPTVSSVIYHFFRIYCLNQEDIRTVKFEYTGIPVSNCSKPEHEWVSYLRHKNPNIMSNFHTGSGLPTFWGRSPPDAYDPIEKKAYFFHGCLV